MDPIRLQLMQQAGQGGIPGIPGTQAPLSHGGAQQLALLANSYAPTVPGNPFGDYSPLAPLELGQRFGTMGSLAAMAGNVTLTSMMEQQGIMPTGNAGSYMQAYRARNFQEMQQAVSQQVANQDANSFYRTFRGAAAMMGMPFDRQQREAAQRLSRTIADQSPLLAMVAPGMLDALAGERGSVQSMAAQMMEANRYRVDPVTGQLGYGTDTNAEMVQGVFGEMFADDNLARMQGLRAGDMGQMYRRLASEGLMGPRRSLRDRTLRSLQDLRSERGSLEDLATEAGVMGDVGGNLAALSNADLQKLRQTGPLKERLTEEDSRAISRQLQDYVGTLSAVREIFGENGDPNAPIPQLIGALEAMTSGQMHKFDANRLNTMVRDMQALSQQSGKSIDQLVAMNQAAVSQGNQYGLGGYFAPTATSVGVTTGMAFAERGAATGFGTLDRASAEQAASSLFTRGMASEMSNTLGTLGRIEEAGGFSGNAAGQRMEAIMEAARSGRETYIDPETGAQRRIPTREANYRSLISQGAVEGMNLSTFNMMLGDRTSNLRFLSEDTQLQQAAFNQQGRAVEEKIARTIGNRLSDADALRTQITENDRRYRVGNRLGRTAGDALAELTPEQLQNTDLRNRTLADALRMEAANQGIELNAAQALNLAASSFGQAENVVRRETGLESYTAFAQVLGDDVRQGRRSRQLEVEARSQLNETMSGLGPQGSLLQRSVTALQRQGDRGESANLTSFFGDMFGVDLDSANAKLTPQLEAIRDQRDRAQQLSGQLADASPAEQQAIRRQLQQLNEELRAQIAETRQIAGDLGIGGGEEAFNREDLFRSVQAQRELETLMRNSQTRSLASGGPIGEAERATIADSPLSEQDLSTLAFRNRQQAIQEAEAMAGGPVDQMDQAARDRYQGLLGQGFSEENAREILQRTLRDQVGNLEQFTSRLQETHQGLRAGQLPVADQEAILRQRRSLAGINPTAEQITQRQTYLEEQDLLPEDLSAIERNRRVEDQLIAENRLRVLGQLTGEQHLLAGEAELADYDRLDAELREQLQRAPQQGRAAVVDRYLGRQQFERFRGTEDEVAQRRRESLSRLSTAAGQRDIADAEAQFDRMTNLRREFLLDEEAVARGGPRALVAMQTSRQAEEDLQLQANRYYSGNLGRMLVDPLSMSEEGLQQSEQEFRELGGRRRKELLDRLRREGRQLDAGDFGLQEYRYALSLETQDRMGQLGDSLRGFSGAASGTYRSLLDPTEATRQLGQQLLGSADEQQLQALQAIRSSAALQGLDFEQTTADLDLAQITRQLARGGAPSLQGLSADQQQLLKMARGMDSLGELGAEQLRSLEAINQLQGIEVGEDAEALGMSEAEYRRILKGGELPAGLQMFQDTDEATAEEQLAQARRDLQQRGDLQVSLSQAEAELARHPGSAGMQEQVRKLQSWLEPLDQRQADRMKKLRMDPSSEADQNRYRRQLQNQSSVQRLLRQRERVTARRQELKEAGWSEEEIDTQLTTLEQLDQQAAKQIERAKRLDLAAPLTQIAQGFGVEQSADELDQFRSLFSGSGSAMERNQQLVARALEKVKGFDVQELGTNTTAIEKLDAVTDQYAEAETYEQRKQLAERYNVSLTELDRMMAQTEFTGIGDVSGSYGAEDLAKAMQKYANRDIEKEVKQEEAQTMRITGGTVHITGDVVGQGTFRDVTAVGSR